MVIKTLDTLPDLSIEEAKGGLMLFNSVYSPSVAIVIVCGI